jgi:hypothetical protein
MCFNLTISLGETVTILFTVVIGIYNNANQAERCIVKVKNIITILEGVTRNEVLAKELASISADMDNKCMFHSTSMKNVFNYWSRKYFFGHTDGSVLAHLGKPLYSHILEIIDARPLVIANCSYSVELDKLRETIVRFVKSLHETGSDFCSSESFFQNSLNTLENNIDTFLQKINVLKLFNHIEKSEIIST